MYFFLFSFFILAILFLLIFVRSRRKSGTIAFFHPYCNAGGGGERVLWCAIRAMQERWPDYKYVVFSGDSDASKEQILLKAKQRFGIEIDPHNVDFIFLRYRRIVEADLYPRFTLALQTIAGFFLGLEALTKLNPEIFVDSMGYPFTLPLFKFAGSTVIAYVHYPTISCDMIDLVERRETTYNNSNAIANSDVLSKAKLLYYKIFAFFYRMSGKAADVVMVNGSWTKDHIAAIWRRNDIRLVFPPCDVSAFLNLEQVAEDLFSEDKVVRILSIGQIRPEKNHRLQLEVLKELNKRLEKDPRGIKAQLTIAGGCRDMNDQERVYCLQELSDQLEIEESVKWKLNIPYDDLLQLLSESLVSLHTMWNEHFGISVVEGMAAGTVMLAHNSGGPKMDIVVADGQENVGFLAATRDEFVEEILRIIDLGKEEREEIRRAARRSMKRFSEEEFHDKWCSAVDNFVH